MEVVPKPKEANQKPKEAAPKTQYQRNKQEWKSKDSIGEVVANPKVITSVIPPPNGTDWQTIKKGAAARGSMFPEVVTTINAVRGEGHVLGGNENSTGQTTTVVECGSTSDPVQGLEPKTPNVSQ
ncbi:hypothetical protein K7X08_032877 [Anisodus acutangulus]|uniref:Uncharacterized protein n=1 Tax=Anisodus acutangulus TaxID=402998 RepID=A0A9Q1M455_9SOLA|nr:hypothetical protein K7X08_032877 [Anisodus acutangulus]